jgi:hypothetical protein
MTIQRWFSRASLVLALGALLSLAACSSAPGSPGGAYGIPPTNTATTTTVSTPTPPNCGANFANPTYYTTLPDSNYQKTNVYAQVQLPPLTRSFDNDAAGGLRGREMCSAGTTASVLGFMQTHLTSLGWQQMNTNTGSCIPVDTFGQQQCWKNGSYTLTLAINTNTDWIIVYRDPDFS